MGGPTCPTCRTADKYSHPPVRFHGIIGGPEIAVPRDKGVIVMHRLFATIPVLALSAATVFAQAPAAKEAAKPAAARQAATASG